MDILQLIFIIVASATLGSALMVATSKNLIHSALWLVAALFGVAIIFVLLNAGFLAVVQVVIYIGAIAILNRKRELSKAHIRKLAEHFAVDPGALL